MNVYAVSAYCLVTGVVTAAVDTAWMKKTLQDHFSEPRHHVTDPTYKAQTKDFILKEFRSYGLETHEHTFPTNVPEVFGINIIGILKGKHFKTEQDRILGMAAHYDTMRETPGVDDNGAAVVAMLQAAKNLAQSARDHTVMFVAFDFEEWEEATVPQAACTTISCGSEAFMTSWVGTFWDPKPTVTGVIVMDTIMNIAETPNAQNIPNGFQQLFPEVVASINSDGKEGDFLAAVGRPYDSVLLDAFVTSYTSLGQPEFEIEKMKIAPLTGRLVTSDQFYKFNDLMRSDHYTFWKNGIVAIFLTDTANFRGYMSTCYHKSCDMMSQVTDKMIQFAGKTTQALINTVNKLTPPTGPSPSTGRKRTVPPTGPSPSAGGKRTVPPTGPSPSTGGTGLASVRAAVDTAWMKKTLQDHFSETRHHVTNPTYKAQTKDFILGEFRSYGLETHEHTFPTRLDAVFGTNIIGILKGKNFKTKQDKIVGMAAHYDTMRETPGVDDNGAAVVAMLQAAKKLAQFTHDHTVVFVAFDFEEWEEASVPQAACTTISCGSEAFMTSWVSTFWDPVPTVTGVIVMDTIMNIAETPNTQTIPDGFQQLFPEAVASINSDGKEGDFLAAVGRRYDSVLLDAFVTSYTSLGQPEFEIEKIQIAPLTDRFVTSDEFLTFNVLMRSDHYTFWKNGIVAIYLTDTANFRGYMSTCYHQSCDMMSRVTDKMIQFAGKTTQALINTVNKLTPPTGGTGRCTSSFLMIGSVLALQIIG